MSTFRKVFEGTPISVSLQDLEERGRMKALADFLERIAFENAIVGAYIVAYREITGARAH